MEGEGITPERANELDCTGREGSKAVGGRESDTEATLYCSRHSLGASEEWQ